MAGQREDGPTPGIQGNDCPSPGQGLIRQTLQGQINGEDYVVPLTRAVK
jgi:hypothetical protein